MESKFRDLPDISNIQPEGLIKYRVSEDRFSAEVLLPGFWYTDFDQKIGGTTDCKTCQAEKLCSCYTGRCLVTPPKNNHNPEGSESKMNLWSVAKLFECLHYTVLAHEFGYCDKLVDSEHSIFMASTTYHLTDLGNRLCSHTHWGLNFPLYSKLILFYVGSSAFSYEVQVSSFNTGDDLMTGLFTFVHIDTKTRRPTQFPEWYNALKSNKTFGPPVPRLPTPDIPQTVFEYKVSSSYDDIDYNGHVNQSVFVRWCTDAGTEAALKGHYQGFTENIGKYPLDTLQVKYIGEGNVEENFDIKTWQDTSLPLVLHFVIYKGTSQIFVARFNFKSTSYLARL